MPFQIPIDQIVNFCSVIVLLIISRRFWEKTREHELPSLNAFRWFFILILFMMILFSLPLLLIKNPLLIQVAWDLGSIFFLGEVALLIRFIAFLIAPKRKLFTFYLPVLVALVGVGIFAWQILELKPSPIVAIASIGSFELIEFKDTSPILSNAILGGIGLTIFISASLLFLRTALHTLDKNVKKRSFLLSSGFGIATLAIISNFVLPQVFEEVAFFFVASAATFASIFLVYRGALVEIEAR